MTKSRTALMLIFAGSHMPVAAQATTEEAVNAQRAALRNAIKMDCPRTENPDEIVVCGARDHERHRLAAITPQQPGTADRAGGEQRAALAAGSSPCTPVGRDQRCNGGLDVIGIAFTIARAVDQALITPD